MNISRLRSRVKRALEKDGLKWSELTERCQQIVLFGSVASGCGSDTSDVDLLCVGFGKRHKSKNVDLVWYDPDFIKTRKWMTSELGSHIAKFGVWLHGERPQDAILAPSRSAIFFKKRLIKSRAKALMRVWEQLSDIYKEKHVTKLRRDLQRLAIMELGLAVPASPILDKHWDPLPQAQRTIANLVSKLGAPSLIPISAIRALDSFLTCSGRLLNHIG